MQQYNLKKLGFRRRYIHYFLLHLAKIIFWFIPWNVYGKENIPPEGIATLFVSNHISHLDSVFTAVAAFPIKRAIRFSGAKDFMKKIMFRWTKYELAFPVGRGPREREKFIQTAVLLLMNNEAVGIYPEGRRSRSGTFIQENVKLGAAWIAKTAGRKTKVVPVFVYGTDQIIPVGKFFRLNFNVKVRIYFGNPLNLDHFYDLPDSPEISKKITHLLIQGILEQQKICYRSILNIS
jgi:1-acyl-sn-glycerol-3-phosphate acyltransferase